MCRRECLCYPSGRDCRASCDRVSLPLNLLTVGRPFWLSSESYQESGGIGSMTDGWSRDTIVVLYGFDLAVVQYTSSIDNSSVRRLLRSPNNSWPFLDEAGDAWGRAAAKRGSEARHGSEAGASRTRPSYGRENTDGGIESSYSKTACAACRTTIRL